MMLLAVFVSVLSFYSLVSRLLDRTVVTALIVFTVAGMLAWLSRVPTSEMAFAHGLTAVPGTGLYSRRLASLDADAPEHDEIAAEASAVDAWRPASRLTHFGAMDPGNAFRAPAAAKHRRSGNSARRPRAPRRRSRGTPQSRPARAELAPAAVTIPVGTAMIP